MKGPRTFVPIIVMLAGVIFLIAWAVREQSRNPLNEGQAAYRREDWPAAEACARAALKINSSDPQALQLLARTSARQGRDDSTEAIYRRLGTKFMEAEDLFLLGRGLLVRGQVGPALASLGAARDLDPDHAETLDALSHYWAQAGSLADAVAAAERLSKQPGWEVRGDVRLGRLRSQLFDPAGAASVLAEALRRDPQLAHADLTPPAARTLLARAWLQSGRPAEARAVLADMTALTQGLDAEGWWLESRAFLQESKFADCARSPPSGGRLWQLRSTAQRTRPIFRGQELRNLPPGSISITTKQPSFADVAPNRSASRHSLARQRRERSQQSAGQAPVSPRGQ